MSLNQKTFLVVENKKVAIAVNNISKAKQMGGCIKVSPLEIARYYSKILGIGIGLKYKVPSDFRVYYYTDLAQDLGLVNFKNTIGV